MVSLRISDSMRFNADRCEIRIPRISGKQSVRLRLRSHADQCKMSKITFRVRCVFNRAPATSLRADICRRLFRRGIMPVGSIRGARLSCRSTCCGHIREGLEGDGMANTRKQTLHHSLCPPQDRTALIVGHAALRIAVHPFIKPQSGSNSGPIWVQ
jgi:hypothetical protein